MTKILVSLLLLNSLFIPNITTFHIKKTATKPIEVFLSSWNRLTIQICLGFPFQCLKVSLSSSNTQLWVIEKGKGVLLGYDSALSNTFTMNTQVTEYLEDDLLILKGQKIKDELLIGPYRLSDFPFFVFNTTHIPVEEYQGTLGLSYYSPTDNNKGVLAGLYDNDLINKEMFYIQMTTQDKGVIVFGEYPPEYNEYKTKYKRCSVLDIKHPLKVNNEWQCIVNAVYYANDLGEYVLYAIEKEKMAVSFSLGTNGIFVPFELYAQFIKDYLGDAFIKGNCFKKELNKISTVYCNKKIVIDNFGDVNFIIGKWSLKLKSKELFRNTNSNNEEGYSFLISNHKAIDYYIFGSPLFKKYTMIFNKSLEQMELIQTIQ